MRIGSRIPLAGLLVFVLVAGVFADAARAETIKTSADGDYYGAAVYGVFSDADGFDTTGYADSYTVVRLMEFTGQFPAPMSATLFPPQFTVSPDSQFFMLGFVDVGAGDGNHLLISIDGADPNVPPPWTAPVALHDNLRDGILD
jgi:hypothetical protein